MIVLTIGVSQEDARKKSCFAQNLESIADAQRRNARLGEMGDGCHGVAARGDSSGAQVVAVRKSAGNNDACDVFGAQLGMRVGLEEGGFDIEIVCQPVQRLDVAVGSVETRDQGETPHCTTSTRTCSMTALWSVAVA